ncbi:hypothetical protein EPN44_14435 [bacterium]|nr:MAG: hypothetical protein EPN44_14435 [bacterium]
MPSHHGATIAASLALLSAPALISPPVSPPPPPLRPPPPPPPPLPGVKFCAKELSDVKAPTTFPSVIAGDPPSVPTTMGTKNAARDRAKIDAIMIRPAVGSSAED